MDLRVINGARVLVSADGTNTLYIDIGSEIIPVTPPAGSIAAGGDGGYYMPNVDANGNVTWITSKADMPAIASSNIRGPAGRSVFGINISVDTTGAITGGTVFYDDGSTSKLTFSLSED